MSEQSRPSADTPGDPEVESGRRRLFAALAREEDGLAERIAAQWAQSRAERRTEPAFTTGPSNFSRAQVPWGLDLAAAWSWRLIAIAIAMLGLLWTLALLRRHHPAARHLAADRRAGLTRGHLAAPGRGAARPRDRRRDAPRPRHGRAAAHLRRPAGRPGRERPRPTRWSPGSVRSGTGCAPGRSTLGLPARRLHQADAGRRVRQHRHRRHGHPGHRGRHGPRPRGRGLLHRAVLHLLLPRRRRAHLVVAGADRPPRRARARRRLGPRRVGVADPVRAGDGPRGARRRDRDHAGRRCSSACRSSWPSACWSSSARSSR